MCQLHDRFPAYDFRTHKGYVTKEHTEALEQHGPCPEHRRRFVNVRRVEHGEAAQSDVDDGSPSAADPLILQEASR
jgi:ribonuclease HII